MFTEDSFILSAAYNADFGLLAINFKHRFCPKKREQFIINLTIALLLFAIPRKKMDS